jgi:oligopeptide/dipeptide ABC transporter ATP-binding protein
VTAATARLGSETYTAAVLSVERLSLHLRAPNGETRPILRELSFHIDAGEVLALVGESGSGKSMTALSLVRLLPPSAQLSGRVELTTADRSVDVVSASESELRAVRGRDVGFVFQDPLGALDPRMRVIDQVAETIRAHQRLAGRAAHQQSREMLQRVGLGSNTASAGASIDQQLTHRNAASLYPHQLSGGMRQRALIAAALVNHPRLLIADEPTTALDTVTQAAILTLIRDLCSQAHAAVLLITHDLDVAGAIADRIAVLYAGRLVEIGEAGRVLRSPAHPYTRALLAAHPARAVAPRAPLPVVGVPASAASFTSGCAFAGRCSWQIADCERAVPELVKLAAAHSARCLRTREVEAS